MTQRLAVSLVDANEQGDKEWAGMTNSIVS